MIKQRLILILLRMLNRVINQDPTKESTVIVFLGNDEVQVQYNNNNTKYIFK